MSNLTVQAPLEEPARQEYFMEMAKKQVAQLSRELGRPLTCCINTFGCQMNARDSEKLLGILEKIGYQETTDEHADFVLYNTCTVRENANLRVYGRLGYLNTIEEEKSTYDDRPVRLHDAGTGGGGENQKELSFRGYYFRYPQHL